MTKMSIRNAQPCDGCARRRVRCEGLQPCRECRALSVDCTFMRPRAKRGPKGRRTETALKVSAYQQSLVGQSSVAQEIAEPPAVQHQSPRIPLSAYVAVLELFRKQLFSIWPVLSSQDLVRDLEANPDDHENYALAAAVCAGSLAQLRISDSPTTHRYVSAATFEQETHHHRRLFDFRDRTSVASLLTSFFLHMYWANNHQFRSAEWYLREAVLYTQRLSIDDERPSHMLGHDERELQIRIYWVVYVTERTFCVQHNLEAILDPIDELPQPISQEDTGSARGSGLVMLAQMFSYLHKDVLRSLRAGSLSISRQMSQRAISNVQSCLSGLDCDRTQLAEVQRVDLVMTRDWIRTLLWHYTVSNYPVSCSSDDEAFSSFLPKVVARNLLVALSSPTEASLRAHGYGMELKVFKVADSLLDVLACGSEIEQAQSLYCGARDTLSCLERILVVVGGQESSFLRTLHRRMQEIQLRVAFSWWSASSSEHPERVLDPTSSYSYEAESTFSKRTGDRDYDPREKALDRTTSSSSTMQLSAACAGNAISIRVH